MDGPYVVTVKSTVEISQNFFAFSEYMNFNNNRNKATSCINKQTTACGLQLDAFLCLIFIVLLIYE